VFVKTRAVNDLGEAAAVRVGKGVDAAILCVQSTIAVLQTDWANLGADLQRKVKNAASSFLGTDDGRRNLPWGGLTDTQHRTLMARLELIINGLNCGELNIKVGTGKETHGRTGKVGVHLVRGKSCKRSWTKTTFSFEQMYGVSVNVSAKMGDITVNQGALGGDDEDADFIVLLIHEAAHKFAGAWDHQYVQGGLNGVVQDIDTAKCLENADSIGHFCGGVVGLGGG
jgi:hypothetical protein